MKEKILILGSTSFAGASFINYCLDQGCSVLGISRSAEYDLALRPYGRHAQIKNFRFEQADINSDFEKIKKLTQEFQPDFFADYAGQGMVAQSWQNPEQWYETNIVAKVKLHDWLKDQKYLKKFLRVSTPEVYGSTTGKIKEDTVFNPSTPYAVSHAATDMSLRTFYQHYGFPVVSTRTANFYGPGQQLYRIVPRAILSALTGKKLPLHGGGHSVRSFVYSQDFSHSMWLALTKGKPGEIYHVASDEYVSIRDLVQKVCHLTDVDFNQVVEITGDRPAKDQAYYLDTQKAQKELGWKNKTSLDEGLKQTVDWVKKNLNRLKELPWDYEHKK